MADDTTITVNLGANPMAEETFWSDQLRAVVLTSQQGHAFCMESNRLGFQEGKVGYREGLSHRIISESGAGQARAHLPAAHGGVPTTTG